MKEIVITETSELDCIKVVLTIPKLSDFQSPSVVIVDTVEADEMVCEEGAQISGFILQGSTNDPAAAQPRIY